MRIYLLESVHSAVMVRLGLYVLCAVLLTACASAVSIGRIQGRLLRDDPQCGTAEECYAKAIEALKEAEQMVEGLKTGLQNLNQTVNQEITRQSQVNDQLKANQTKLMQGLKSNIDEEIGENTNKITTNKNTIASINNTVAANSKGINSNTAKFSMLKVNPCNCQTMTTKNEICPYPKVSYLDTSKLPFPYAPTKCCDLCLGSSEGEEIYPLPPLLTQLLVPESIKKSKTMRTP